MKKRLLAFFLAFAMVFSLMPVSAFAAEADAAALYTDITTESGEEVTAEYVETVVGEAAWGESINTPYYHVTVPQGTEKVLVTYPEDVELVPYENEENSAAFFYRNSYAGQSEINYGGGVPVETNDDGSKTVTIPVASFILSANGSSTAVGMMYYVDSENRSAAEFFDFTYAAPTHKVTLTSGEGYTLTGKATVEDGKDYSFTVTIADGYEMEDNFVVKANGETLTAGESGGYTVENVTADLTITVEGVVKQQPASHTVTLTSGEGYTLKGETTVANGADYTFSLKFANYYGASSSFAVKANGTALTANEDGTYTVKNVTTDLTITVEGVARLYKIFLPHGWSQFTMSAYDGYADPSTDPSIARDGDYKFKVTPNDGFAVRDNDYGISFSGNLTGSVEVKDGYAVVTLTNIRSNGEVKIEGVKQIITVTLPEGEGFTAAAAEGTKTPVLKGDSYSFTVTVAEGYEKTDDFAVKANATALTAGEDGSYTIANVAADQTVTVEGVVKQQPASHTVTLTSGEGYTLKGETTVANGADYTFSVEIAKYYGASSKFAVKANGTALTANEDGTYTVKNVTTDLTITVEGVTRFYKITLPHGWSQFTMSAYDGYAAPTTDPSIARDGSYKFKVTPNEGFAVRDNDYGISFSGNFTGSVEVKDGYAVVTLTKIRSNGEVKIEGVKQIITVTLPEGEGFVAAAAEGTKTPVLKGDSYSFTVTVAEGYEKTDDFAVKANGTALTANEDGSYTIANVTANQTITVEGVAKKQTTTEPPFTSIKTLSGEDVVVEYKGMVPAKREAESFADGPYYHVTIPAGTTTVLVVYPENVEINQSGVAFTHALTIPDYTLKVGLVGLSYRVNDDGSKTVGIPVEDFLLDDSGKGTAISPKYDGTLDPISFFTFSYDTQTVVSHTITLTSGEGYTLTGETTVTDGDSYSFSIAIADGYEKTDSFAVKANGRTLTASADGTYTIANVTADQTVTVEGVAKKQVVSEKPFISIVTASGEDVDAQFVGVIPAKTDYSTFNDGPYYHVTVPAGTESVLVTYPASVGIAGGSSAFSYTLSVPDYKMGYGNENFTVATNDDGSKTVTIPVANYLLDENGSGTGMSLESDSSYDPITFFTFAYEKQQTVSHTVTLTAGEGYTLTGEAAAEDGKDYTFTVTVAEGFVKNGAFAVKANDTALTANEDGSYTVSAVAEDVTITVEGVMSATANGLSVLKFTESNSATAAEYELTPAFDPAVKEYTIYAPDTKNALSIWATYGEACSSKAVINAKWTNQSTGADKTMKVSSGKGYGQTLSAALTSGNKGNTITVTVTDGDYTGTYTVNIIRTDPTLSALSLDSIKFNETFKSATKYYTASTADESVTVKFTPRSSDYTVTVNGGTSNVIALEMGENVIEIVVQNARGDKNTYTITVTRVKAINVTLNVTPAKAKVTLTDARGTAQTPDKSGVYRLMSGATYNYRAVKNGYLNKEGSFVLTEDGAVDITMEVTTAKPVTVYFSFSHDANFEYCSESGATMALKKVTVPYFDLANYGMEGFYFKSESYGATDPDNPGQGSALTPGTAEYAFGKITMLHLFIYSTEVYYCGIDPEDAGEGYLYDSGLLGTDLFSYSGSTGSIFLQNIWNYDLNLNYYLNHEYPLASEGWGSTCDQILLHDDDVVTLGHFTDWSFYSDSTSVFNHFEADNAAPVQGEKFTLSVIRDGADMSGNYTTGHYAVTYCPNIYCALVDEINSGDVTTWTLVGTADSEGKLTVDTSDLAPGEYIFAMAGQPGAEYTDSICSTPGGVRVTIQAKPAVKGDMNGDGIVDTSDVTALYKAISDVEELDASVADVNGDGVVDVFDVMAIYDIIKNAD